VRSKFTLVLLALNLALFGYLLLSERPWSATQRIEENRRRVLGPEAADLAALEIAVQPAPGDNAAPGPAPAPSLVRLERREGSWFLAAPLDWPANDFAVRRILNELQFLEHETSFPVSDLARNGQTLADFGLDQPRVVVTATPAAPDASATAPAPFTLKIGATAAVGNRLYILSPDERRIHVVGAGLGSALALDLGQLRSDQLFTIPVFEARALTLQAGSANAARTRLRRDQTRWLFEAPITARAAKTPVELAINDLNALRVARFVPAESAPPPEVTGLSAPRLRVTLEGNARRETLLLGEPVPGSAGFQPASVRPAPAETVELYARLDWRAAPDGRRTEPVLFTVQVPSDLLKKLDAAQTELRDRRVLDLDPARVTAISISAPRFPDLRIQKLDTGSAWQIAAPAAASPQRADPLLVERLLQRLQLLEASRFVSDAPSRPELENLGFNLPQRVVTLQLAPAAAGPAGPSSSPVEITLEFAQPNPADPALFARVAGQPFIYAVPPETLAQIPVAPIVYRDRSLLRLPDEVKITRLVIRRADAAPEVAPLLDHTPSAEPAPAPVATLLAALRDLRARTVDREEFSPTTLVDGVERPWAYTLEAVLDPAPSSGPLRLSLAERSGASTQQAGSEALGLVFTLEQPVLDALWQLLYREPKP
jgi:hypothetical protein